MMSKCAFCEALKMMRDHEHHELRYEYTASVDKFVYDGKHFVGRSRRSAFDLRFCPECGKRLDGEERPCGDCPAIFAVKAMAASDLVPVVRCRDCAQWPKAKANSKGFLICPARGVEILANDFCSRGERRRDNADT